MACSQGGRALSSNRWASRPAGVAAAVVAGPDRRDASRWFVDPRDDASAGARDRYPRRGREDDPDTVLRYGERAGGLVWWIGAPPAGDKINRQVLVVGHDPATGRPSVRVDLGLGLAGDAQAIGDELWLTVARRRFLAVPRDRGVEVLAVSAFGAVRTVHSADSVDISRFAPPLRRAPDEQIRDHINEVRHRFDHLESFWQSPDGATSPLSDGLSNASVSVEGEWPEACVIVTVRHRRRPGLMLRRAGRMGSLDALVMSHCEGIDSAALDTSVDSFDGITRSTCGPLAVDRGVCPATAREWRCGDRAHQ